MDPMFSPDGRWIAYESNESGRNEVYVRPFPGPGGKRQISTGGGGFPTWSRVRRELVYRSGQGGQAGQMFVVSYAVDDESFRVDKARAWSDRVVLNRPRGRTFDLHPDGERLAVAALPDVPQDKQDRVVLVFNFFDELRRVAPVKR